MKESFRTNHPKYDLAIRRTGDGSDIEEAHPLEEQNSAENEFSTSVRLCTICILCALFAWKSTRLETRLHGHEIPIATTYFTRIASSSGS
jgi:hypothetical protein